MKTPTIVTAKRHFRRGFSLIEMMAAATIMGILVFLALPNVNRAKSEAEENFVISRAQSINMALSGFIQSYGRVDARDKWSTSDAAARYNVCIKPFLAYPADSLANYTPAGYTYVLPATPYERIGITSPAGQSLVYSD